MSAASALESRQAICERHALGTETFAEKSTIGIGLWLDMRNPPAWQRSWSEHYARALERTTTAERLGLRSVWLAEHHLFDDGYLPQPLTFAAAIAARTSTLRIGTAILQAPLRKAIDIAEQGAIVDVLSDGRLELGLGAGYAAREFEAYGVEHGARHGLLRQNAREIIRLWEQGVVTPPPTQSPPPLWIGALGPQLSRFAGEIGAGLLSTDLNNIAVYKDALEAAGHERAAARCMGRVDLILADDPERAWSTIAPHQQWIVESYAQVAASAGGLLAERFSAEIDPDTLRMTSGIPTTPRLDVVTPEDALARLRPWAAARPLEHISFVGDLAGLPDDLVDRHIELVTRHLVGAFERPQRGVDGAGPADPA